MKKPKKSGTRRTSEEATVDLSKKTALVWDHGVFIEFALRLARKDGFGRVFYYDSTAETAFATVDHAVTGDGYQDDEDTPIIRLKEPWELLDAGEIDVVVFPDVHHGQLQKHIELMGIPVWGGRRACDLETNKLRFKKIQEELGMNHAPYDLIEGLEALREFCREPKNEDRWIKITPQFRGNKETFHHKDYLTSLQHLAEMQLQFGILGSKLKFLAEHPLKGKLEGGLDTYTIDGTHPQTVVSGWEKKDMGYFAEVVQWDEIAQELRETIDPLWPLLKSHRCRQLISTEVMIEDRVLLEPTIRTPSPAGEEQMELYRNFPLIVWEGANGRLIEPELECRYACEAMVEHEGDDQEARHIVIPNGARRWVKLYNTAKVDDALWIGPGHNIIGAVVGIGDSPEEALAALKKNSEAIADQPVKVHIESLAELIDRITEAKKQGKAFTQVPLPEKAEVVE